MGQAVDVTTLPLAEYVQRLNTSALGPQANETQLAAEWRAMGLVEGELHLDDVGEYAAVYRPVDVRPD